MRSTIKGILGAVGLLGLAKRLRDSGRERAHTAKMRRFYGQFIRAGGLAFDVGANVGNRTGVFLSLGARVVAVEPQADCVAKIRAAYGRNPRLTVFQGGLADKPGQLTLHISSNNATSSMAPDWIDTLKTREGWENHRWEAAQTVPVTTLDALIAEHGMPSFVKIDVEGFELPVLQGLSHPVSALSFEYSPEYLPAAYACLDQLTVLGRYRFNISYKETMDLGLPAWVGIEEIRRELGTLKVKNRSGDIYAIL